ncbi:DoxX-like family protein [Amycolatopsis sacchari]|uniref:DoxX-like family protein n=2 Tax=Amycolatopsis sacchari TaxID=115433 RepID=A0A1I3UJT9_9PSEU|nr:DoxX family protein [Amycolatopsis sacchari]SFJ83774.1 DoxX-like family protein [Amycolatopsis sacchari]
MHTFYVTLTVVFGCLLLVVGPLRLIGLRVFRSNADTLRVPYGLFRYLGLVEFLVGAGLLIGLEVRPVGVAAAVVVVLESVFSVVLHLRIREALTKVVRYVPTIVVGAGLLVVTIADR